MTSFELVSAGLIAVAMLATSAMARENHRRVTAIGNESRRRRPGDADQHRRPALLSGAARRRVRHRPVDRRQCAL